MLGYINQFIGLFIDSLRQIGRGKIWLSLFVLAVINGFVLYMHYDFLSPLFYSVMSAWTSLVSKSAATMFTHYPMHFVLMPFYYGIAKLVPGLIFESLILGAVAIYFRNSYLEAEGSERLTLRSAVASWGSLIVAWVLINGLTVLVSIYFPDWFRFIHQDSPRRLLAFNFLIMPAIFAIILSLFFFAIPAIAIFRENFVKGIKRSLKMFVHRPITCLFLSGVILAGPYLLSAIAGYSEDISTKFKPELVFWVLAAGLVVELLANYFWMGTAVKFLLEEEQTAE